MRTAHRFPINGDYLASGHGIDRLYPGRKTIPELLGIQEGENPTEGIMGRDAARQLQKSLQPLLLGLAEYFQIYPAIRSADDTTNGNGYDVDELVPPGVVRARVFQTAKIPSY